MHLLVDGVCGAVLSIYAIKEPRLEPIIFYFGFYTVFAFGLQGPVGWLLDKVPTYTKKALITSTFLLALGTIPQLTIGMQAALLGLGNCLFHVVGGSYVLRKYNTYSELGLFVSSGAIGLGLGLYSIVNVWQLLVLAFIFTGLSVKNMQVLKQENLAVTPKINEENSACKLWGIIALLFGCIVLRGFGSDNVLESPNIMLLPCTLALGKFLGGYMCDKIGYKKTVLIILAIGFVGLKIQGLYGGLLFVLASNMTMPLTLRLAHWCRIGAPGLVFGLAASCLVPGTVFKGMLSFPPQLILVLQFLILVIAGFVLLKKEYQHG